MAKATNNGDNIIHAGLVRIRVLGEGNLRLRLLSMQDVISTTLNPVAMETTTNRLVDKIANFSDQRIQLEMKTIDVNEIFEISRFYVFVKESVASYPVT